MVDNFSTSLLNVNAAIPRIIDPYCAIKNHTFVDSRQIKVETTGGTTRGTTGGATGGATGGTTGRTTVRRLTGVVLMVGRDYYL